MRILGVRRDGLRLFGSTSQAAGVEKLSGLRGGRGLPARAAQVIHAGMAHPPAWEMSARTEKAGAAVGRSPRAGKEWLENRGQEGIVWFLRGDP